jgi:hypothetical protein
MFTCVWRDGTTHTEKCGNITISSGLHSIQHFSALIDRTLLIHKSPQQWHKNGGHLSNRLKSESCNNGKSLNVMDNICSVARFE